MTAAMGSYKVGERTYPLLASPRCRTCRSPHRGTVEGLVARGTSYAHAARSLPHGAGLSSKNIRQHCVRGHVPVQSEVVQRLIEAAGGDRAAVLEIGVIHAVRALALASAVVGDVARRVEAGDLEPTFGDGIKAARLLMVYDIAVRRDRDLEGHLREAQEAMVGVLALVKGCMAPEGWTTFLRAMEAAEGLRPFVPYPSSG